LVLAILVVEVLNLMIYLGMVIVVAVVCVLVGLAGNHLHGLFCVKGLEGMDIVLE
jgi:hypothetical protein